MEKWVHKILLCIVVAIILGHSFLPHHHHEKIESVVHQHQHNEEHGSESNHPDHEGNKEDEHNIFSFAQLDENFVPANGQTKNFELPVEYLAAFIVTYLSNSFPVNTKTHFGWYKEYPPPEDYRFNLPSRAPPAIV